MFEASHIPPRIPSIFSAETSISWGFPRLFADLARVHRPLICSAGRELNPSFGGKSLVLFARRIAGKRDEKAESRGTIALATVIPKAAANYGRKLRPPESPADSMYAKRSRISAGVSVLSSPCGMGEISDTVCDSTWSFGISVI
jgi:hypothetical protein